MGRTDILEPTTARRNTAGQARNGSATITTRHGTTSLGNAKLDAARRGDAKCDEAWRQAQRGPARCSVVWRRLISSGVVGGGRWWGVGERVGVGCLPGKARGGGRVVRCVVWVLLCGSLCCFGLDYVDRMFM